MAEINSNGYTSIRNWIDDRTTSDTWSVIELVDDTDTPVIRLTLSDSRVSIPSSQGANPYTLRIEVSPSDADISSGQTFAGSRIFKTDTNGDEVTPIENFSSVTLNNNDDVLVVRHDIEAPEIV